MNKWEVFKLIEEEREHQDSMYGGDYPTFDQLNDTAQWLVYIEAYVARAKSKFMGMSGVSRKLHEIDPLLAHSLHEKEVLKDVIKVAALCVAALEHRGFILGIEDTSNVNEFLAKPKRYKRGQ